MKDTANKPTARPAPPCDAQLAADCEIAVRRAHRMLPAACANLLSNPFFGHQMERELQLAADSGSFASTDLLAVTSASNSLRQPSSGPTTTYSFLCL